MTAIGIARIVIYLAVAFLLVKPLGAFMARVYMDERTFLDPVLAQNHTVKGIFVLCRIVPAVSPSFAVREVRSRQVVQNQLRGLKGLHHRRGWRERTVVTKSGGVELGHSFVTEVIADLRAEKPALRFGSQEGVIFGGWEIKVAINIASVAESQV